MPDSENPTILLVGHCFPDQMMLKAALRGILGRPNVEQAHSVAEVEDRLPGADLALVNRVLDGDFADDSGIALIGKYASAARAPLMLISNYPESQAEAEAVGAAPGFGKTAMYAEETAERIKAALAKAGAGS